MAVSMYGLLFGGTGYEFSNVKHRRRYTIVLEFPFFSSFDLLSRLAGSRLAAGLERLRQTWSLTRQELPHRCGTKVSAYVKLTRVDKCRAVEGKPDTTKGLAYSTLPGQKSIGLSFFSLESFCRSWPVQFL